MFTIHILILLHLDYTHQMLLLITEIINYDKIIFTVDIVNIVDDQ